MEAYVVAEVPGVRVVHRASGDFVIEVTKKDSLGTPYWTSEYSPDERSYEVLFAKRIRELDRKSVV